MFEKIEKRGIILEHLLLGPYLYLLRERLNTVQVYEVLLFKTEADNGGIIVEVFPPLGKEDGIYGSNIYI